MIKRRAKVPGACWLRYNTKFAPQLPTCSLAALMPSRRPARQFHSRFLGLYKSNVPRSPSPSRNTFQRCRATKCSFSGRERPGRCCSRTAWRLSARWPDTFRFALTDRRLTPPSSTSVVAGAGSCGSRASSFVPLGCGASIPGIDRLSSARSMAFSVTFAFPRRSRGNSRCRATSTLPTPSRYSRTCRKNLPSSPFER